jgi:protein phosphatase
MKPVAIISNIHANLPALTAVLEDIDNQGIEELACLSALKSRGLWLP